jgi:acetyl-CoA C-acetyltransferase
MTSYPSANRPVIIGVGQIVNRSNDPGDTKSALDLIKHAVKRAENDSQAVSFLKHVDLLCLVNTFSMPEGNPLAELRDRLDIRPDKLLYSWVGATAPQWFVNQAADKIINGRAKVALICGGEAIHSKKIKAKAEGSSFDQWIFPVKEPWMAGDLRDPLTPEEMKYSLILPIHIYPLFENALRHHESLSIEAHRKELGDFCAGFSSISSSNEFAWFTAPKSKEEIVTLSESNPMTAFPYTRSMCSIIQVDQAAALLMTDEQTAKGLGIPRHKWIYLLGSGDAYDIWHVSERINFYSSPSVKVAAEKAVEQADVTLESIDLFDLYSCFPCAPRIARNMLGISKNDPRALTVTGGMPYFGGPGNNYALHAICAMVEKLRLNPDSIGLVQALSWFISKHSVGIYSGRGKKTPRCQIPPESYQAELNKLKGPQLIEEASGNAVVETYTLLHDRSGQPVNAVIIGRQDNGKRFLAKTEQDNALLTAMMKSEFIGKKGRVRFKNPFNVFKF